MLSNNGLCLHVAACAVCVTIYGTSCKFQPVSNFTELHALIHTARSYGFLTQVTYMPLNTVCDSSNSNVEIGKPLCIRERRQWCITQVPRLVWSCTAWMMSVVRKRLHTSGRSWICSLVLYCLFSLPSHSHSCHSKTVVGRWGEGGDSDSGEWSSDFSRFFKLDQGASTTALLYTSCVWHLCVCVCVCVCEDIWGRCGSLIVHACVYVCKVEILSCMITDQDYWV